MRRRAMPLLAAIRFVGFIARFLVLSAALVFDARAAQYALVHGFAGAPNDGATPQGSLATDGTLLYGLTENGGISNAGTVFKVNISGSGFQVLHSFTGLTFSQILLGGRGNTNDGVNPFGTPLVIGSTIYGTTLSGGTNGTGTIFKINTDGTGFALLHDFGAGAGPSDGWAPYGSLVTDGTNLFGMASESSLFDGTIFVISTNGTGYRTLHNFAAGGTDGLIPHGSLVLSGGTLYGMTLMGGTLNEGTIFSINTDGSGYQVLHSFTDADGASPYGSLIVSGSTLYGMTSGGGANNVGAVFSLQINGTGFQVLHSFSIGQTWQPKGDLTLSGPTLYGMTSIGGTNGLGFGTIFQINTDGSGFQIDHTFFFASPNNLTDGSTPIGSLLLSGSQLYGMTPSGGSSHNAGAVFSFGTGSSGGGGGPVGGLKVNILPAGAVSAGGEWQVDNGTFFKSGTLLTNLSASLHVIAFKPITGWGTPGNRPVFVTLGTTNTLTGTYTTVDVTKPTLKVLTPTAGLRVSNAVFTASGMASDNVGVAEVYYQLDGGAWIATATFNNWTNWSAANLTLSPGTNVMKFYAKDLSGNVSATNAVNFTFVVSAQLIVHTNGAGTVSPNLNGQMLEIDKPISMTAKAAKGSAFVGWTGSLTSSVAKISFTMASNLDFTANFKDITRPVNTILTPTKNHTLTSAAPTATGKAKDNVGVSAVWFQVNGGTWLAANLPDGTNWTTPSLSTMLLSGQDSISAFASDAAGNNSLTNKILFKYVIQPGTDWAPDSLNGLLAAVTPASGPPESVGFDVSSFAQTGLTNDPQGADYGAGTYSYLKTDTNTAQLSLAFNTPPNGSNDLGPITLVFTNHYTGYFTNENSGDTGGFDVSVATNFIPATLVGRTITATAGSNGKITTIKLSAGTFVKTPANNSSSGTSSGTYTFTRYSPAGDVFAFSFTDAADLGQTVYVQATFTNATSGTYFVTSFDNLGDVQDASNGRFVLK